MTDSSQSLVVCVVVSFAFVFGTNAVGGLGAVYDSLASQGMTKGFSLVTGDSSFNYAPPELAPAAPESQLEFDPNDRSTAWFRTIPRSRRCRQKR